jgi:hypothetical protein
MDIGINTKTKCMTHYFNDKPINGGTPVDIISDKISTLSNHYIFRRDKNLFDVYALTHCVDVKIDDVIELNKRKNITIDPFSEFCNQRDDIEHTYNKLKGLTNRPLFSEVYSFLSNFLKPFILNEGDSLVWNHKNF